MLIPNALSLLRAMALWADTRVLLAVGCMLLCMSIDYNRKRWFSRKSCFILEGGTRGKHCKTHMKSFCICPNASLKGSELALECQ